MGNYSIELKQDDFPFHYLKSGQISDVWHKSRSVLELSALRLRRSQTQPEIHPTLVVSDRVGASSCARYCRVGSVQGMLSDTTCTNPNPGLDSVPHESRSDRSGSQQGSVWSVWSICTTDIKLVGSVQGVGPGSSRPITYSQCEPYPRNPKIQLGPIEIIENLSNNNRCTDMHGHTPSFYNCRSLDATTYLYLSVGR